MNLTSIRIATRKSQLALWQAEHVRARLMQLHGSLQVELVQLSTQGDKILDVPLAKIGGKGLFVKELEAAILDGRADIAVHSIKDVPMELPPGLHMPVILERAAPTDAFVSNRYKLMSELPLGARLGTSSLRRRSQLQALRPDLNIANLRGNVNTRLQKLDDGEFDAVILATAGLQRLDFSERINEELPPELCLPAVGQGAIGIESRAGDDSVQELIAQLHHQPTADCVIAERAFNRRLQGGCQVPIAGYAIRSEENGHCELRLRGLVSSENGSQVVRDEISGPVSDAEQLGISLANSLLDAGAGKLLESLWNQQ